MVIGNRQIQIWNSKRRKQILKIRYLGVFIKHEKDSRTDYWKHFLFEKKKWSLDTTTDFKMRNFLLLLLLLHFLFLLLLLLFGGLMYLDVAKVSDYHFLENYLAILKYLVFSWGRYTRQNTRSVTWSLGKDSPSNLRLLVNCPNISKKNLYQQTAAYPVGSRIQI